ncbi:universal stress protein [Streptomyces sp. NPDC059378]|uniref:universal stress protein n=1 Tax=Streptomyces sp. NPDC059378 TaxID=3346815 RepID=UPI0036B119A0
MTSHHVVVGVDGSLVSVRASDRAAAEAVRHGTDLRVLYAVPDRDEAAPVLGSAVARIRARHPGLRVEAVVAQGGAVRALARESVDADLTVVGTRGPGALTGAAFGSVSLRLAALAQGPLLVVRGDHARDGGGDVLLGLADDTDARVAEYALREARRRGAGLRVLHCPGRRRLTPGLPSPVPARCSGRERPAGRDRAVEDVPSCALTLLQDRYPGVRVEARTLRVAPADGLRAATREAAVVVIGAHLRTGVLGLRPGPVVRTLLHRAHCPVLVVPHG